MNNQNDVLLPTTLDEVTFPLDVQVIDIEQQNKEFINIIQLTNNSYHDSEPQIWGNNVVWSGGYNYGIGIISSGIFLYDGATTIQLTNNSYGNSNPEIWGNNVVWSGNNQVSSWYSQVPDGYDDEIFLYDGTTTIQLTDNKYEDVEPQIWGNNVVWLKKDFPEYFNEEIFLSDGLATIQLTNNVGNIATKYSQLHISGQNVVWSRFESPSSDLISSRFPILNNKGIFLYDGTTTIQLTEGGYEPKIWGNNVVWQGWDGNNNEVFFSDGTTTIQLTDNNYEDVEPQIWGNNVVWQGYSNDYDGPTEIFFYDGTTTIQLTDNSYYDSKPQIWGNNVVWQGWDGNNEIFFSDGTTTIQLTDNNYDDNDPQIWGNNVVWSGDREIFLATLPSEISESTSVIVSSSMFINDVSLVEGDEGNTDFTFTISIAEASKETITVNYATSDNTAIAGEDYIATSGSLEFAPGETEKAIIVEVIGDTNVEKTKSLPLI